MVLERGSAAQVDTSGPRYGPLLWKLKSSPSSNLRRLSFRSGECRRWSCFSAVSRSPCFAGCRDHTVSVAGESEPFATLSLGKSSSAHDCIWDGGHGQIAFPSI